MPKHNGMLCDTSEERIIGRKTDDTQLDKVADWSEERAELRRDMKLAEWTEYWKKKW